MRICQSMLMYILVYSNAYVTPDILDPLSLFKCGLELAEIKCQTCIMFDSCWQEQCWFRKKSKLEAHLQKVHGIHVVLLRGLKIAEDEQLNLKREMTHQSTTTTNIINKVLY